MENHSENLPLLPLTSGVVLPGMVFTMALESDEAKAAAEAAGAAGGQFVIVPFIDGRYATVGVVAEVMETGELPGGMGAVAIGLNLGAGVRLARRNLRGVIPIGVTAAVTVSIGIFGFSLVHVLVVMMPLSLLLAWITRPA